MLFVVTVNGGKLWMLLSLKSIVMEQKFKPASSSTKMMERRGLCSGEVP